MNPDQLALALTLLNGPNQTLSEIIHEDSDVKSNRDNRRSFDIVADDGEIVGYIKTWHHKDDYAGFVHFDAHGNIIVWKTFPKAPDWMHFHRN